MKNVVSKKVIILGAGVAGMSAAHELIERGFEVEVYELNPIAGGKARSVSVERAGMSLPGEHGFRFFPAFYKHVTDVMRRIPAAGAAENGLLGQGRRVYDNLGSAERVIFDSIHEQAINLSTSFPKILIDLYTGFLQITQSHCANMAPINPSTSFLKNLVNLRAMFRKITHADHEEYHTNGTKPNIDPVYVQIFFERIWQILTSSERRRTREYERMSWWEFTHANEHADHAYRKYLVQTMTRSLIAANAHDANAKVVGDIAIQVLSGLLQPGGGADRVLNGPTNEVWIEPWREYLERKEVTFHFNTKVQQLHYSEGRIRGMTLIPVDDQGRACGDPCECMDADAYYIAALPVEVMAQLLMGQENRALRSADPQFGHILKLLPSTEWMSGIQFYFKEPLFEPYMRGKPLGKAHVIFMDSQWGLTAVSQLPFWRPRHQDAGVVADIVSVIISNWETRGLNEKIAKECTQEEIENEVLAQIAYHLYKRKNPADVMALRAKFAADPCLDPDLRPIALPEGARQALPEDDTQEPPKVPVRWNNQAPLFINRPGTWQLQPEAETKVVNLFLAADYVRTFTQLPTMEAANEAARHAVNGIIKAIVKEDAQRVRKETRELARNPAAAASALPRPAWMFTSSGARRVVSEKLDLQFCKIWNLNESWPFGIWRLHDQLRYQSGLPWWADLSWLFRPLQWGVLAGISLLDFIAQELFGPPQQITTARAPAHPASSDAHRSDNGFGDTAPVAKQLEGSSGNGLHLDRDRAVGSMSDQAEQHDRS